MRNFNIDRFNEEMKRLGGQPLKLKRCTYPEPRVQNGMLVDEFGNPIGTKGDMYTKVILDKILQEGCLDHMPRPHYEDSYPKASYHDQKVFTEKGQVISVGENETVKIKNDGVEIWVPAHTISVNSGIECIYNLSDGESPMSTLRPTAVKSAIDEILWIYFLESNDLVEFDRLLGICTWEKDGKIHNWWEKWALRDANGNYILNEKGHPTIGACYGETVRRRHMLEREVIDPIRKNPDSRRLIVSTWQIDDFDEPHGLKPCAFQTIWNVRHSWDGKDYLDMTLIQRLSDFCTAGCINQVQYATLLMIVAKKVGMLPGTFTWKPINVQIYDRHIEPAIEMLNRQPITCRANITLNPNITSFDKITHDDVTIEDYPRELIKKKNPQLKFQLGI